MSETYITRSDLRVWQECASAEYLRIGIVAPCFMFVDWPWPQGFASSLRPVPNVFFMPDAHSVDDPTRLRIVQGTHEIVIRTCWDAYQAQRQNGIDEATALAVLPLGTYALISLTADRAHWNTFLAEDGFGCSGSVLREVKRIVDEWHYEDLQSGNQL